MDITNCKSKLEMLDIYFSKFSFSQNKRQGNVNLKTNVQVNFERNGVEQDLYRVIINTKINDDGDLFLLQLETIGIFRIDKAQLTNEMVNNIIEKNTVAIMFPFIRSQIALLTSQPGLTPVLLQPINVDALIGNKQ